MNFADFVDKAMAEEVQALYLLENPHHNAILRPLHTAKIFTNFFLKNRWENRCPYIKLLKKSLQL